ncbi:MAG TPA: hypothetical protein VKZ80_02535 [Flavobacterium sp.]|nr:hypothetical protein [Flavobacterium sp.]
MKRIIVDYAKLTNDILSLLVEKFPDGYDDSDIVRFTNAKGEMVEAVEVSTEDTIYLVKVSTKLQDRIGSFEDDEDIIPVESIPVKDIDIDDEVEDDDDDIDSDKDLPEDGEEEDEE